MCVCVCVCVCVYMFISIYLVYSYPCGWYPRGIRIKGLGYGCVVSEFELQSRYYVQFRTNTFREGINPFILPPKG